jgi:signal transduction histidine kinase
MRIASLHSRLQRAFGNPCACGTSAGPGTDLETTIFRIIQEGLTNVHRHSGAKQCWVSLHKTLDTVTLEVRDDGIGLRPQSLQLLKTGAGLLGVGLSGMQERVRQLGGSLEIESEGGGCIIRATFSLTRR